MTYLFIDGFRHAIKIEASDGLHGYEAQQPHGEVRVTLISIGDYAASLEQG
jgi:hypothetical protein